ncbi:MAG: PQQ-dependent sugar dehydrogenase [Cyclobacteriaceae bacterium]
MLVRIVLIALVELATSSCFILSSGDQNLNIKLPEGFKNQLIISNLGYSRQLAVLENGDLIVGGATTRLLISEGDGYRKKVIPNIYGGGVQVKGDYIYFGAASYISRLRIEDLYMDQIPEPELVIKFERQAKHELRTFTTDQNGFIYVNIGAPSNICQPENRENRKGAPSLDPCTQLEDFAGIWRFPADKLNQKRSDGYHYASGIRNAVAIDWNSSNNKLYVVQHGRDRLNGLYPDLYSTQDNADLPAEEFMLVEDGDKFGWPYCYFDPYQDKLLLGPEYGGDRKKIGRCAEFKRPLVGFPAHYSPNDLLFYKGDQFPSKYKNAALVAFHGSWNREPHGQKGFNVIVQPMENGLPVGKWSVFADGFAGKQFVSNLGDAAARPCGLAEGPGGSVYVLDSVDGKIWEIWYEG